MEPILSLVIPFVSLIFLVGISESFVKFILEEILHMSDKTEQVIGYVLTALFAFFIAMFGDYRFLNYLDVYFSPHWLDWVFSALIIAAGSSFLEKKFDFINLIPGIIGGVQASARRVREPKNKKEELPQQGYVDPNYRDPNDPNLPTI